MASDMSAESRIRMEIERNKIAFTYLALGMCVMVVALVFLTVFAIEASLPAMGGAFVVLVVGLLLYEKGVRGRTVVRALENQLSTMAGPTGQSVAQPSTKYCKHCGKSIAIDSTFCEHCGKAV